MATPATDLDDLLHDEPMHGGVYGLWLRVLCLSVLEIQDERFLSQGAKAFIFDHSNIFFDYVSEQLGFDPGAFGNGSGNL